MSTNGEPKKISDRVIILFGVGIAFAILAIFLIFGLNSVNSNVASLGESIVKVNEKSLERDQVLDQRVTQVEINQDSLFVELEKANKRIEVVEGRSAKNSKDIRAVKADVEKIKNDKKDPEVVQAPEPEKKEKPKKKRKGGGLDDLDFDFDFDFGF